MANAFAADRVVNLVVDYKTVNFAGKQRTALAVNNQIPAPVLHFKEGDRVTINVYNKLDEETAFHWHGIILPWQMDGVLGISQHGIQPGKVFQYKFTLHQSGTYWYHAHAGLQEQRGIYSAFIIDPIKHPLYKYTKDYTIVLSDWSNTHPDNIMANLKKEGDYYSPNFPLQPSLAKFIHDYRKGSNAERKNLIDDYKMMQQMRMSIYDFSDVAYDAFLLNGQPKSSPWTGSVKIGDIVRLRFIGAGGSTIFHVKIPGTTMQMVHVQGNDIRPYTVNDFAIAPGETYDVLVKIQSNDPYIIYAESIDTVGAAYGALVTSPNRLVNYTQVTPFPEPLPVTRGMMAMMMGSKFQGSLPSDNVSVASTANKKSNTDKPSHTMSPDMKMDPSMKMDSNMPMDHSMPTSDTKKPNDSTLDSKTSHDGMAMDMNTKSMQKMPSNQTESMSESMPKNTSMPMDHDKKPDQPDTKNNATHDRMTMDMSEHNSHQMNSMQQKPSHQNSSTPNMPMNHSMGMDMSSMSMGSMHSPASHAGSSMSGNMSTSHDMEMSMPTESTRFGDSISPPNAYYETSTGTKYDNVTASVKTNDPNKPIAGVINMELFGYMDRYIWFINGVPEDRAHPIILEPGKRYRFVFTNTSMMHHPMHIHGHWFILRKGNGAYDPLLHTIDVLPGATMTADVDTDASGQWIFHCHLLYHMMAGMARTFQYSTLLEITKDEAKPQDIVKNTPYDNRPIVRVDEVRPIETSLVKHPMMEHGGLWLSTFLDVGADPFSNAQRLSYKGLYGSDYNKLELFTNDAEVSKGRIENADIDIFYWHLISQFWAVKGGANYFYRPATVPYWQPGIGIEGLMPYYIDTNVRGYLYGGSAKLDIELSRDTQITNNFFIRLGARSILASKTVTAADIGSGLNQMRYIIRPYYRLMPGLNLIAEYEHELTYGVYRNIQRNNGESTSETTLTFGLSVLF
jgi:CopA family copper-resistance protein